MKRSALKWIRELSVKLRDLTLSNYEDSYLEKYTFSLANFNILHVGSILHTGKK